MTIPAEKLEMGYRTSLVKKRRISGSGSSDLPESRRSWKKSISYHERPD